MVEESIINTEEKSEKTESEDGDEKPNPTWGLVITKGGSKILSRYLSGPTPSCHDTCKYGIKHAIETKPWNAKKKKVSTRGKNTKIPEETVPSSRPSPNSKIARPNSPVITEKTNLPPSEETDVSMEKHTSNDIKQDQPESSSQTLRKIVESKSPPGSRSRKKCESGSKQRKACLTDGKKVSLSLPPSSPLSSSSKTRKGVIRKKVKDVESNDAKSKAEKVVHGLQTMEGSKRRSFKRKAVEGRKIDGLNLGCEKVLLRHQSLESKKVAGRTYNNVIEETASQLAELRKSKVKALVGAFETVISLDHQEATPIEQVSITC